MLLPQWKVPHDGGEPDTTTGSLIGWIRDQAEHSGKLVSNYRAVGIFPADQPHARFAVGLPVGQ